MMSTSVVKQTDIIDAFNTTSRYLDDILSINNIYFDNMEKSNMPFRDLQYNKTYTSGTENKEKRKRSGIDTIKYHLTQGTI